MDKLEKVIQALENCTAEIKCRDCPWDECEGQHEHVELPKGLALKTLELLKAQEPDKSKWYGSYVLFTPETTREVIEKEVKEMALKTLIDMGALKIIIKMEPSPFIDDDGSAHFWLTGAWKIKLPDTLEEGERQ